MAACEENNGRETKWKEEIQEAIAWYNWVLGLRIEGGNGKPDFNNDTFVYFFLQDIKKWHVFVGVNFMFSNVNVKRPDEVFAFTIRHANDKYTCNSLL